MTNLTRDMLGRTGLTPVDQALSLLLDKIHGITTSTENVSLLQAHDRILSQSISSPEDLPAWPRSTMDGYAVKAADTFGASQSMPAYINLTGEVFMGKPPLGAVEKGCAHRIPTGGLVPEGADAVVMHENTVPVDSTLVEVVKDVGTGTAIIQTGEDISKGAEVLPAGRQLHPHDIGLLAGLGIPEISVHKKPRVAVLSTGDEIIPHKDTPEAGQIRDINSIALAGLIDHAGGEFIQLGIVSDNREIFFPALEKAVLENDIVLFSGGSSVGMRDLGEQAIEALGMPGILVHGVALKPGKPIIIGLHKSTPIFGLPGHPVSALVCFDTFVTPTIRSLSGKQSSNKDFKATVSANLSRNINSAPGRRDVVRVTLSKEDSEIIAEPVLGKSGSISTLSKAHGYFIIDESSQGFYQGTNVEVILY